MYLSEMPPSADLPI